MAEVGHIAKMKVSCIRNSIVSVALLVLACIQASFAEGPSATTNVLRQQAPRQPMQQDYRNGKSISDSPQAAESPRNTPGVCDPSLVQDDAEAEQRWSSTAGILKVDEQRQALVSVLLSYRTSILVTIFGLITTATVLFRRRRH